MVVCNKQGQMFVVNCLQDTCTGFLLGGIGELDKNRRPNFFVVDKSMCAPRTLLLLVLLLTLFIA